MYASRVAIVDKCKLCARALRVSTLSESRNVCTTFPGIKDLKGAFEYFYLNIYVIFSSVCVCVYAQRKNNNKKSIDHIFLFGESPDDF